MASLNRKGQTVRLSEQDGCIPQSSQVAGCQAVGKIILAVEIVISAGEDHRVGTALIGFQCGSGRGFVAVESFYSFHLVIDVSVGFPVCGVSCIHQLRGYQLQIQAAVSGVVVFAWRSDVHHTFFDYFSHLFWPGSGQLGFNNGRRGGNKGRRHRGPIANFIIWALRISGENILTRRRDHHFRAMIGKGRHLIAFIAGGHSDHLWQGRRIGYRAAVIARGGHQYRAALPGIVNRIRHSLRVQGTR
jgi:hypothetical protein